MLSQGRIAPRPLGSAAARLAVAGAVSALFAALTLAQPSIVAAKEPVSMSARAEAAHGMGCTVTIEASETSLLLKDQITSRGGTACDRPVRQRLEVRIGGHTREAACADAGRRRCKSLALPEETFQAWAVDTRNVTVKWVGRLRGGREWQQVPDGCRIVKIWNPVAMKCEWLAYLRA